MVLKETRSRFEPLEQEKDWVENPSFARLVPTHSTLLDQIHFSRFSRHKPLFLFLQVFILDFKNHKFKSFYLVNINYSFCIGFI
jgi:hypothetical protein